MSSPRAGMWKGALGLKNNRFVSNQLHSAGRLAVQLQGGAQPAPGYHSYWPAVLPQAALITITSVYASRSPLGAADEPQDLWEEIYANLRNLVIQSNVRKS